MEQQQPEFINGLIIKEPKQGAPDFVKANISIKRAELMAYLAGKQDEWLNIDVKLSKKGSWYCQLNNWKPNQQVQQDQQNFGQNQAMINNFDQNYNNNNNQNGNQN